MGIEPEQMLVNHNIAAERWIEKSGVSNDVEAEKHQGACQHRGGEHNQDAGAEHGPAVHRKLHQLQARTAQFQDGGDEINATED